MISFNYTITDPMGLHARPAGLLVKEVKKYRSLITVVFGERSAEAGRMMAVMRLGTKAGDTVTVHAEGEDEAEASEAMKIFFAENV